jgi:hypothetical protein
MTNGPYRQMSGPDTFPCLDVRLGPIEFEPGVVPGSLGFRVQGDAVTLIREIRTILYWDYCAGQWNADELDESLADTIIYLHETARKLTTWLDRLKESEEATDG